MVLLLVSWIWILYIEDLCDIFGKNKWLFSLTKKSKIDISHTILIGLHSICESDPFATEQWDLQIFFVLQLPNLLYEPIVGFPVAITVVDISSNTAVLVGFLVALCPCIKCVPLMSYNVYLSILVDGPLANICNISMSSVFVSTS
jgi:hypothetical protein